MDLLAIRTRLRPRIGNPSVADVADSLLTQHINDALEEIVDRFKFKALWVRCEFTTVIGTDRYLISGSTDQVADVWDRTNGVELSGIVPTGLAMVDDVDVENGKPEKFLVFDGYIRLLPPPDGAYVISFHNKKRVTVLTQDTDVPEIPQTWHRAVLLLSAYYYYSDTGKNMAKGVAAYNEYSAWIRGKPVEADEERKYAATGVRFPGLESAGPRLDFDQSP